LNLVLEGGMGVAEAAGVLGLSDRQAWRIMAAYRREGVAALAHGNRGCRPANATSEEMRQRVIMLAGTRYAGVNHTHLTELLAEREEITLSRATVRNILVGAGIASPRHRRPPQHRCRRERMPQEGVLVQIDGSYHNWLESRGPWLTLLLAVDDATGTIPWALFSEHEDAKGYFRLLWGITQSRGVPLAVYTDRHSVFQPPHRPNETVEESLFTRRGRTQVGRALRELGISQVFARSPEAKGRVERMAGTFQDRLISELRLAGASNMADANRVLWQFLPGFNQRFGVPSAQPVVAYRPVDVDLAAILCFKYNCKVARDNTVKYRWHTLQLLPDAERRSYTGVQAEVQIRLDGNMVVFHQGRVIPSREAPPRAGVLRSGNNTWINVLPVLPKCITDNFVYENVGPESAAQPRQTRQVWVRKPSPRQRIRWEAVQTGKRRGLSGRAIARELGISRNTVAKYLAADRPILNPPQQRPSAESSKLENIPVALTNSLSNKTDIFP
jgi:transposase